MIPLYPPRQGDPSLKLVKWKSLVHLVSHSHNQADPSENVERTRTKSLSELVFSPNSRKHSSSSLHNTTARKKSEGSARSSSLERNKRRPSAPSLTDLRRFLSNITHKSRSSTNVNGDDESAELIAGIEGVEPSSVPLQDLGASTPSSSHSHHQRPVGAKNKVQRLKAIVATNSPTTNKETVAVPASSTTRLNFFKKQERKPFTVQVGPSASVHGSKEILIRPTVASAGDAQLPIAETKQKCEEDSVVVIADQFPSSKVQHPISSLPSDTQASAQTVPKAARKKSSSIQLLTSVFHRKRSAQHTPSTIEIIQKPSLNRSRRFSYPPSFRESKSYPKLSNKNVVNHVVTSHNNLLTPSTYSSFAQFETYSPIQSAELFTRRHSLPDMAIAAYGMVICGNEPQHKYRGRIEKVKFGVPISEAFSHDIPATLLVLLLKVNKEGPLKKDIWRAPGNQAQVRKLSHIMQQGRLVNISHISVYTAASVIKKFLSKLPGGIFGAENEQQLFSNMQNTNPEQQRQLFCRVISSLPLPSQHLLVLLFGTFRIIADSSETFNTRMTPDAIGISVAPSLFHTCMQDEQKAKLEDVMRFKLASQVISKIIQSFGYTNLFTRESYEFYARITGRRLMVDEQWHFSFAYPSRTFSQPSICFKQVGEEAGPSGLKPSTSQERRRSEEAEDEDIYSEELPGPSHAFQHPQRDRAFSASGATGTQESQHVGYWRQRDAFSDLMEQRQLSTSMGEVLLHSEYERAIGESLSDRPSGQPSPYGQTMSSRCAESLESTRSLTYLEWVHEKQTKRMRTRSEWFLSPAMPQKNNGASKSFDFQSHHFQHSSNHPQQLKKPETDTEMSLQSSTEEMRTTSSHSSSIKEQRPLSPIMIVESSLDPMKKVEGEITPRLPFQLIQHHSGEDDDAPLSATPPARQQPPVFFGDDAPPAKTSKSSSSSSGTQSQKSVLVGPSPEISSTQHPTQSSGGLTRVSSIGVVRRKSWRTHYVRPNKSLDQESAPKEKAGVTSSSTPAVPTRRSSANGDSEKGVQETSRLIRRKSSNSTQVSKLPVQARHSTQI